MLTQIASAMGTLKTSDILVIYHGKCPDGQVAAWAINRKFRDPSIQYYPGVYGKAPPPVEGKHVILVDFSYSKEVIESIAASAKSVLILDHHASAQRALGDFPQLQSSNWEDYLREVEGERGAIRVKFDMEQSGAGLAWRFFHPQANADPWLVLHIEDRDLWRYRYEDDTEKVYYYLTSFPFSFEKYDEIHASLPEDRQGPAYDRLMVEGTALLRLRMRDTLDSLDYGPMIMTIGGYEVEVFNVIYPLCSMTAGEAAKKKNAPFAASYFDEPGGRRFSLRSRKDSATAVDVSVIAAKYGGGGHVNAAGFRAEHGWMGDKTVKGAPF